MAAQLSGTLSNFVTRVRRYLGEETAAKSFWADDFVKQAFNVSYRRRCAQLVMTFEGYFVIVATRDLVANQERYAWPAGFSRLQKMELVRDDTRTVPLARYERHYETKPAASGSGDSYLPTYRPIGSGFVLEPAPVQNGAGELRIEYIGTPVELTADDDELHSDFPKIYDEILVLDTAILLFDAEQMQESGRYRSLLRQRQEWELDFERFIDNKLIAPQAVTPFVPHYSDS